MAAVVLAVVAVVLAVARTFFDPREFARAHAGIARLSITTGNTGGVYYPYGGGLARVISVSLRRVQGCQSPSGSPRRPLACCCSTREPARTSQG